MSMPYMVPQDMWDAHMKDYWALREEAARFRAVLDLIAAEVCTCVITDMGESPRCAACDPTSAAKEVLGVRGCQCHSASSDVCPACQPDEGNL